jgi:hypothetical protein
MRYDDFAYLWPPRPESAIAPRVLGSFEHRRWIAQIKYNGTANVIFVAPDKTVTAMSRHNEQHRQWSPTQEVMADFARLPGRGWYVFVAELLHNKVADAGLKNINYTHDVLVADGEYLVGHTQEDRQGILQDLLLAVDARSTPHHYEVSPNLWLPVEYESGFDTLFEGLTRPEHEGLVLKDPRQKLSLCLRQKSNIAGLIKCRRTHKNYSF